MKLFHTVNSGWLIRNGPYTILVDAIHDPADGFSDMPQDFFNDLHFEGEPAPRLCGVLFTHKHSDHYSAARLKELQQARGPFSVIDESSPSYRGTTLLSLGTFNITRFPTVHDGPQFRNVPHVSYLIRSGDTALLFPGDADLRTTDKFAAILNFLGPHIHLYGFFNPYQMQCQAMWDLVDTCKFEKVYVNHLPRLEDDIYDLRGVVKYTCHHMPERKLIIPPEMSWVQIKEPVRSL